MTSYSTSPLPPSRYFSMQRGGNYRIYYQKRRRRNQKGGFFSFAAQKAVDRAFDRLQIRNADDLADKFTKRLVSNAINIPLERLSRYKKAQLGKIRKAYKTQVNKLLKPIAKLLT